MLHSLPHLSLRRRGAVALLLAFSMVALLSVVALSLDGGSLLDERRHAQATADAAAMAAASDLFEYYWKNSGDDPDGSAAANAFRTASNNGFTNDGTQSTVIVNIPPQHGLYQDKRGYVEVIVEFTQRRSFSTIFAKDPIKVKARAVALGAPTAGDVGILVLEKLDKSSFSAGGGGTITVEGTPVIVNSNHVEAAIANGGTTVKAPNYYITGGYATPGGSTFIGEMFLGRPGLEDPLSHIQPPNPLNLTQQSNKKIQYTSGSQTLSPGVYKNGISVSGTGSLTLQPGIYYMDGGGFSFSGQGSLTGPGVMIYNAPGNGNADGISITGQGTIDISGPTSGNYQGLTFFQDRTSSVTGVVSGTGVGSKITGTFYFAGALLKISGNGGVSNLGSQYISRWLELGGNGGIYVDWSPDKVARKRAIHLVE